MVTKKVSRESGRSYFAWTSELEEQLIDCIVDMAAKTSIKNGAFKVLKAKFQAYQLCKSQSGWGWDDVLKCPFVDETVFNNFVKTYSSCAGLNGKPYPQWDRLLKVFGKGSGTGEGAVAANEDPSSMQESDFEATLTGLDSNTPLDEEGMANFMDAVINEVVDMPTPNGVRNEQPNNSGNANSGSANSENAAANGGDNSVGARQRRPAARRIELESSVSILTNEISEIRPAIQLAIDGMVNRLLGEDDDSAHMRHNIWLIWKICLDSLATKL
ncbi:hypothetical protein LINPERHAP1_LOCUS31007 [Linum perenne]